jgi:hypothetical protein
MGARAMGMAYASSCSRDEWALLNNPAGLATVKNTTTSFTYNSYPSFKSFNTMAATLSVPIGIGVTGIGMFRYGDNVYNEQVLSAGFSNKLGIASLGAKVNYVQYTAEGYGTKGVVTVSFGGIASLTDKLLIGAYITNINRPRISGDQTVPAKVTAGLGYKASDNVFLCSELEKDLDQRTTWKTGIEYQFQQRFFLRTGFNVNPDAAFAGFGFRKKIYIDYAAHYSFATGLNHQATVGFKLGKK